MKFRSLLILAVALVAVGLTGLLASDVTRTGTAADEKYIDPDLDTIIADQGSAYVYVSVRPMEAEIADVTVDALRAHAKDVQDGIFSGDPGAGPGRSDS